MYFRTYPENVCEEYNPQQMKTCLSF